MIAGNQADSVSIRRVRVRLDPAEFDPLGARIQLERLLAALNWSIPWLSPSAVLCIKQLPDPSPGTLRLGSGQMRPAIAWERALLAVVEDKVRRAARPALGAVPSDAEAVVFADRGELIACLILDWCDGRLASQWWWSALFGSRVLDRAAIAALLEAPEYLPPVIERVVQARRASRFSTLVSVGDVERLLSAVIARFGLEHLRAPSLPGPLFASRASEARAFPDANPTIARRAWTPPEVAAALPPVAPWSAWLEEPELATFDSTVLLLFGIALTLRRAPASLRTQQFAEELERYWVRRAAAPKQALDSAPPWVTSSPERALERESGEPLAPSSSPPLADSASDAPGSESVAPSHPAEIPSAPPPDSRKERGGAEPLSDVQPSKAPPLGVESPAPSLVSSPSQAAPETSVPVELGPPAESHHSPRWEPLDSPTPDAPTRLARVYGAPLETKLGGLFYLANLALALGFYPDFTRPREQGLPLSIWDFIALIGERLLERPLHDPAWALLQRLAGRSAGEPPGVTFSAPSEWRLPPEWLRGFSDSAQGYASGGRLRIEHAAGFAVLDAALQADPESQLEAELRAYPTLAGVPLMTPAPIAPEVAVASSLERWLGWLVPYVRARLYRALGLAPTDALAPRLLMHTARVHVSDTHVDVRLALAELPIAIRSAGLDRDPGWLPAAGRFLSFHFD